MLQVVCVLKSGGEYEASHVAQLQAGFAAHLTVPHEFVCLTDARHVPGYTLPLLRGWQGWWSKLELFDGRLQGDVLYADLDTRVVGNCDALVAGHKFTVLENFWATDRIGSGLMAWGAATGPQLRHVYDEFRKAPAKFILTYRTTERWGDQGFIRWNCKVPMARWQHKFPGRVVSFKRHVRPAGGVPPAAAIVCFHGQPRPWELTRQEQGWFDHARAVHGAVALAGTRA